METVEPVAAASSVRIELSDDLRELTYVTEHEHWDRWRSLDETWRAQLVAGAGLGRPIKSLGALLPPPAGT